MVGGKFFSSSSGNNFLISDGCIHSFRNYHRYVKTRHLINKLLNFLCHHLKINISVTGHVNKTDNQTNQTGGRYRSRIRLIRVPISLLANAIKFGNAVGFAYQSPPPSYFKTAISCPHRVDIPKTKRRKLKNFVILENSVFKCTLFYS